MKKIISAISTIVLSMGLMAGIASATSCTITNTGNGSFNSCYDTSTDETIIACSTNASVVNTNVQTGASGTATVSGNTSGGGASSGSASNDSEVQNALVDLGCGATAAAPQTPTTTKPQAAEEKPAAKQVAQAPEGSVNAGAGDTNGVSLATIVGLIASVGAIASGAFLVRKFQA